MRIYSLSKILAVPVAIVFVLLLYYEVGVQSRFSFFILIPVVLLVGLYIMHGVIDHWYLERNPIKMDDKMRQWFAKYSLYYQSLSEEEKLKFESRQELYVHGREFKSVGTKELKDVPYDLQSIISSQCTKLTLGLDDYLLGDLDRVYVYKHPFKTPKLQSFHNVEVEVEDGVLLLNTEYALPGVTSSDYFNIALYGYADAYSKIKKQVALPKFDEDSWQDIEAVLGLSKQVIVALIGLEEINLSAVHAVAFFDKPDEYKARLPEMYRKLTRVYNQSPSHSSIDLG